MKKDMVNHPDHYKHDGIETINVIKAWTKGLTGIYATDTGNVIKYISRWKDKNGLEDLKKAQWYLNHLINELEREDEVGDISLILTAFSLNGKALTGYFIRGNNPSTTEKYEITRDDVNPNTFYANIHVGDLIAREKFDYATRKLQQELYLTAKGVI